MVCLWIASVACWGQQLLPAIAAPARDASSIHPEQTCNRRELQAASELTFRQQACYYEQRLAARSMLFRAVAVSELGTLRNAPYATEDGFGDFGRRFGIFYAQRSARYASEMFAGYLNHEDPRFHPSRQEG